MRILSHHVPLSMVLLVCFETAAAAVSVYLAAAIRFGADWVAAGSESALLFAQALTFSVFVVLGLAAMGLYQSHLGRLAIEAVVARILAGLGVAAIGCAVVFFLLPSIAQGRGILGISLVISLLIVTVDRLLLIRFGKQELFRRRVLVYGAGESAQSLLELRRRTDQRGFKIVAFVPAPGDRGIIEDERLLDPSASLVEVVERHDIDEVVVAMDDRRSGFPSRDLLGCKSAGADVLDLLTFLERESGRINVELMNPSWIVFADGFTRRRSRQIASRFLDVVCSLALLLLTWPVMAAIALVILMDDGAPVLYRQTRVGWFGKPFEVLKFRSMCNNAEQGSAVWATKDDARVTRVGSVIRKLRLDELPQIFNVLRGEMSLVGPRPERPEFVEELARKIPYYQERHCVKPGLTGWAQLRYPYGASESDALQKLRFDLYYVKNQSFIFDLMILLQTVEVVFWQKGSR